jgi:hypothetical protein
LDRKPRRLSGPFGPVAKDNTKGTAMKIKYNKHTDLNEITLTVPESEAIVKVLSILSPLGRMQPIDGNVTTACNTAVDCLTALLRLIGVKKPSTEKPA